MRGHWMSRYRIGGNGKRRDWLGRDFDGLGFHLHNGVRLRGLQASNDTENCGCGRDL